MRAKWNATLEKALLIELNRTWVRLNRELFREALQQPALQLHDGARKLGHWHRTTRTLSMSRGWIKTAAWGHVVEVLKHEMAHQFVSEILKEHDQTAHGPAFRSVCDRFRIDPKATGLPSTEALAEPKAVERIRKLLALANSPNEHEAQAALAKAHRMMTQHEVAWSQRKRTSRFNFRQIGPRKGRFDPWEKGLAGLLGQHFFVHPIWVPVYDVYRAKTVRVLEIIGRPEALEVAEYAHEFLTQTAERLWKEHRKEKALGSNKHRRTFLLGVMMGFAQRLELEQKQCTEVGLVPIRDAELDLWFRQRHRWIRTRRGGAVPRNSALQAGKAVGRSIQLREALVRRRGLLQRLLG